MFVPIMRLSAVLSLLGWAALHFFWDVPYREYLWSQALLGPFVETLTPLSWAEFAVSDGVERGIAAFFYLCGSALVAGAFAAAFAREGDRKYAGFLKGATAVMVLVSLSKFKEAGFQFGMLIEYAAQAMAPILLYLALGSSMSERRLLNAMKIAVALTFTGHGLYALGYYPVPGNFVDMVIGVLGTTENEALSFLLFAGTMDLLLCVALFTARGEKPALLYATAWGLATALARPLAGVSTEVSLNSSLYWIVEAFCRTPHVALPFAALCLIARMEMRALSPLGYGGVLGRVWRRMAIAPVPAALGSAALVDPTRSRAEA